MQNIRKREEQKYKEGDEKVLIKHYFNNHVESKEEQGDVDTDVDVVCIDRLIVQTNMPGE